MHKRVDGMILGSYVLVSLFGMLMVYSASSYRLWSQGDATIDLFMKQGLFVAVGFLIVGSIFCIRLSVILHSRVTIFLVVSSLIFLFMVKIPGLGVNINGAKRWLSIVGIQFQPADFAMLALVFYLAHYYRQVDKKMKTWNYPLIISGLLASLILTQPKVTGALMVLFIVLAMIMINSVPIKYIGMLIAAGLGSLLVVAGIIVFLGNHHLLPGLFHHVYERIISVSNPFDEYFGSGYQMSQSFIAIYNGGLFGLGLGNSMTKQGYLPVAETDFIFSIIVEEWGLLFSMVVLALLLGLCARIFYLSYKWDNHQEGLLLTGIGLLFFIQITVNISSISGLIPMTGIPLPFISYGGTNFLINSVAVGVVLNIASRRHDQIDYIKSRGKRAFS
ncbi:FtsW/RodA/SpoVE family cell cycle protein [Vagococcus xieshaowenii]|uniref:Probable peptidoglycan glycosyltransferase FtsW n=1 Tax=Vagococcus xieshaowenii TaxID=2562451 RepID=A0AAJ5EG80_9ENTE|nr:FtsW/RodA/SpoVE family cell cycle protein [Vagococcus xieshaowenii]QCA29306.1 FtsW/RodA/SpoVE family cell cycle protein [Vagococcus xieshaowenii]TFZ41999.1 FtsW/RodA/SpoVE family cell cycle protein [Vagococcus xieshaowenii]